MALGVAVLLMSSCASVSTDTKDIKYMPIRFKPLSRNDFTLVGNLQAEFTITGKGTKATIDPSFQKNYKKGLLTKIESTEVLYFAPENGQTITGALYENDVFNTVFGPTGAVVQKGPLAKILSGVFKILFPAAYAAKNNIPVEDHGMNFAYYTMVEKYPDVDYFINVRFDRKTTQKGKNWSETIIVKADGVKLKTDN